MRLCPEAASIGAVGKRRRCKATHYGIVGPRQEIRRHAVDPQLKPKVYIARGPSECNECRASPLEWTDVEVPESRQVAYLRYRLCSPPNPFLSAPALVSFLNL